MRTTPAERAFGRSCVLLLLLVLTIYAATSEGLSDYDVKVRWMVAEMLFREADVMVPATRDGRLIEDPRATDHRAHSVFFPGQSIQFLPWAGLTVVASGALGIDPALGSEGGRFLVGLIVMPVLAALAVLGHMSVLRLLGVRPRVILMSGFVLAFGTFLWHLGTRGHEEPTLAALSIWGFWCLLDAGRAVRESVVDAATTRRFVDGIGAAGVLLALGLTYRPTFATLWLGAAVMVLPLALRGWRLLLAERLRLVLWGVAVVGILSVIPIYNWVRYGDLLAIGYASLHEERGGLFATPLLTGLRGHLLSPGKSIFLYVPWLILLPLTPFVRRVRLRLGILGWALLVIIAAHLAIHSLFIHWHAMIGWGVRYHALLFPLLLVPIAVWIDELRPRAVYRALLATLVLVSVVVQIAGNCFRQELESLQHPENYGGYRGLQPEAAAWTWGDSPLRLRFINVVKKLRGQPLLDAHQGHDAATRWNVFPAAAQGRSPAIVRGLWALWGGFMLMAAACAIGLWRQWRRLPRGPDGDR